MAGKAKSVYLTVTTLDHKTVFHRMFFEQPLSYGKHKAKAPLEDCFSQTYVC